MMVYIKNHKKELFAVCLFLFFAFGFNIYRIQGDGRLYYAMIERTLNIPDPESSQKYLEFGFQQSGSAFFNIPFYLLGYSIEKAMHRDIDVKGITLRSAFINLGSNFYMILSLLLMFKVLKLLNLRRATISIVSVLFSTSAFVVAIVTPAYNHVVDIFLATLFMYLMVRGLQGDSKSLFLLGITCVAALIVRYVNVVLIIPPILFLLLKKEYRKIWAISLGFLSVAWIFPLILYHYNGNMFTLTIKPEAPAIIADRMLWYPKYLLRYLVHPIHGIFVWSPVTILSAIGLIKMSDEKPSIAHICLSIWILFLLLYGFLWDWHAGWSFSNRYMVSLFPIYIIGLCYFLDKYGRWAASLTVFFTCYSVFLFFNWYLCVIDGFWGTPIEMFEFWAKGKSHTFKGGEVNLSSFAKRIFSASRYKHIFGG